MLYIREDHSGEEIKETRPNSLTLWDCGIRKISDLNEEDANDVEGVGYFMLTCSMYFGQ